MALDAFGVIFYEPILMLLSMNLQLYSKFCVLDLMAETRVHSALSRSFWLPPEHPCALAIPAEVSMPTSPSVKGRRKQAAAYL